MKNLFFLLLLLVFQANAQDVLYFTNGDKIEAPVTSITDKVTYKDARGTKRSFDKDNFVLLINRRGDILVIAELNLMNQQAEAEASEKFLDGVGKPKEGITHDIIIKKNGVETISPIKAIKATITYESDEVVNFRNEKEDLESLNKNELLCIIYKDGTHKLLTSAILVADNIVEIRKVMEDALKPPAPTSALITTTTLTEAQVGEFADKGQQKVVRFANYLKIIADKSIGIDEKDRAIDQACELFLDNAKIEVSSVNRTRKSQLKIRDYLTNLKQSQYDEVGIEWTQIAYVKNLTKEPDGTYSGVISAVQTFEGKKAGQLEYADVTKKEAKIKLARYDTQEEGQKLKAWDVMIGDIRVVETKKN